MHEQQISITGEGKRRAGWRNLRGKKEGRTTTTENAGGGSSHRSVHLASEQSAVQWRWSKVQEVRQVYPV